MDVDQTLPPDPMPGRWADLEKTTQRPSARFAMETFDPESAIGDTKILVIGAGGLGCEILKCLALSGFRQIDVIDLDTIDLSNLNRQFLFRHADIGKPKATVAADFVKKRVPGVNITPHYCMIQDMPAKFYRQFHLVIMGLDSIGAREWMTDKLFGMLDWVHTGGDRAEMDPATMIPILDGGTEGFKGHFRLIMAGETASFKATSWMFPPQVAFPMCTIESNPRLPEHCVAYVKELQWEREKPFGAAEVDGDNPEHIKWIAQHAHNRAQEYKLGSIDYQFAQGVVKNIIPAIASTNAIVAAACTLEAIKAVKGMAPLIDNYVMYNGNSVDMGVYAQRYSLEAGADDPQLRQPYVVKCQPEWTTMDLLNNGLVNKFTTSLGLMLTNPNQVTMTNEYGVELKYPGRSTGNEDKPLNSVLDKGDLVVLSTEELGSADTTFRLLLDYA